MKSFYMKSVIVASSFSFLILFIASLQSNTIPTSIFRGSIGLLPGALFGIILAYIWDLVFMDVGPSSSGSMKKTNKHNHQTEEITHDEHSQDTSYSAETDKQAAEFVKSRLND
ncbi:hypothetical protein [Salisediminibacterium beveridgei]|uniref:Uncharacterized protein n=1 Tax=Salisediminibacterium beveridgei TaxID=632773 RepID=A0A1D7QVX3_9BACI|nr:hypothetical protein [Salisediminibacterium beveridgei]AOM83162.1 hypothetical protein BBEV_1801 [Salisediminibacterium beveridgei]